MVWSKIPGVLWAIKIIGWQFAFEMLTTIQRFESLRDLLLTHCVLLENGF